MQKQEQTQILRRMIRKKKKLLSEVAKDIGVTTTTLDKYLKHPLEMRGDHRVSLAESLGVSIETLDLVINGRLTYDAETVETLLQTIKP